MAKEQSSATTEFGSLLAQEAARMFGIDFIEQIIAGQFEDKGIEIASDGRIHAERNGETVIQFSKVLAHALAETLGKSTVRSMVRNLHQNIKRKHGADADLEDIDSLISKLEA